MDRADVERLIAAALEARDTRIRQLQGLLDRMTAVEADVATLEALGAGGRLESLEELGVRVTATGSQAGMAAGSTATISGGSEEVDQDGAFDGSAYTVPEAGVYMVHGWAEHQNTNANQEVIGQILHNGGSVGRPFTSWKSVAGGNVAGYGFHSVACSAGDTLSMNVTNGDTAARTVAWRFAVERIS